ncbi:Gfo/Idh/MocA family oxidoreductase [Enterococcus sp. UD-01]|jgi:myo-inositol 2-dehydrogenase/D-chiro-inositol 1-dehydrogenase|uniref:Gfo/Idh/MocA family oxidoreductase n=1 Tax=Enterococcus sp. UD-01 TaxID=3373911 RepID=UPI0038342B81
MDKLKLGVIGAGRVGQIHIENIFTIPTIELVGIADANIAMIQEKYPTVKCYKTADELLAVEDIAAVCIFTSTDTHEELCLKAARAGKHIFCEKPLSMSLDEVKNIQILKEIKAQRVQIQIGFNRRFDTQFSEIKAKAIEQLPENLQVVKITSRDPDLLPHALIKRIGGLIFDFTMHDFDMARFIMGKNIQEVFVKGDTLIDPTLREIDDIDTLIAVLTFEDGSFGIIDNSRKAVYGYDQRLELFGSFGMFKAENISDSMVEAYSELDMTRKNPYPNFAQRYRQAYHAELVEFADSLIEGREVPVSGIDAIMAQRVAIAAEESLKTGKPIKINTEVPLI